jgi:hypothetical protein
MSELAAAPDGRIRCVSCTAPYLPRLTGGSCPVCDTPAPEGATRSWLPQLAIVVVATVLNVVLLGLLAVLIARL